MKSMWNRWTRRWRQRWSENRSFCWIWTMWFEQCQRSAIHLSSFMLSTSLKESSRTSSNISWQYLLLLYQDIVGEHIPRSLTVFLLHGDRVKSCIGQLSRPPYPPASRRQFRTCRNQQSRERTELSDASA